MTNHIFSHIQQRIHKEGKSSARTELAFSFGKQGGLLLMLMEERQLKIAELIEKKGHMRKPKEPPVR